MLPAQRMLNLTDSSTRLSAAVLMWLSWSRASGRAVGTDPADKGAAAGTGGPRSTAAASAPPGGPAPPAPASEDDSLKSAKSELGTFISIPDDDDFPNVHVAAPPAGAGPGAAPELDTFISPPPTSAVDTFITPAGAADTFLPARAQQASGEARRDLVSALPSDYNTWR